MRLAAIALLLTSLVPTLSADTATAACGGRSGVGLPPPEPVRQDASIERLDRALAERRWDDAVTLGAALLAAGQPIEIVAPRLALAHRRIGEPLAALELYERWLRVEPLAFDAWRGRAEVRRESGDLAGADAAYRVLLERWPERAEIYRDAASLAIDRGENARVETLLVAYLELASADAETLNALAIARYQLGHLEAAVATFERALALDPDHLPARFGLGIAQLDAGEAETGVAHLAAVVEAMPDNATVAYQLGLALAELGRTAQAVPHLRRATELEPERPAAWYRLALALRADGEREAGAAAMQRFRGLEARVAAARADAARRQALLNEVVDAAATDDHRRAELRLAEALEAFPDAPETHLAAARYRIGRGDAAAALPFAEVALRLAPTHPDALYLRGLALIGLDRFAEALESLEQLARLRPLLDRAHAALGNAWMGRGDVAEAIRAYEIARDLAPDQPAHLLNLAAAYGRAGEAEKEAAALAEYRRLLESSER